MGCVVGCRHGLDLTWLWLWCRPAAVASIRPLAWEPPCAKGGALKSGKKNLFLGNFGFSAATENSIFFFKWPHPWYMEVPEPRSEPKTPRQPELLRSDS